MLRCSEWRSVDWFYGLSPSPLAPSPSIFLSLSIHLFLSPFIYHLYIYLYLSRSLARSFSAAIVNTRDDYCVPAWTVMTRPTIIQIELSMWRNDRRKIVYMACQSFVPCAFVAFDSDSVPAIVRFVILTRSCHGHHRRPRPLVTVPLLHAVLQ